MEVCAAKTKADIVKALNESLAYCDAAYASLTDASAGESVANPFGQGTTGRWLDATGRTIGRNSERTPNSDYKLDLRLTKTVVMSKVRLQGIVEGFNILNTKNLTNYNGLYGSNTYLQPASSTEIFYQPRQLQFGFRVTY